MIRSAVVLACVVAACARPASTASNASSGPRPSRQAGLASFEIARSVLQHPRCQNCHPAGDAPLAGDDSHPHPQNVQRGPHGEGMAGAMCTTCHGLANPPSSYGPHVPPGASEGWHMPPPERPLVFVGKTPRALCEQVKDQARNGGKDLAALRSHLDTPLVMWGWNPGLGRAAIPITRATFVEAWETWASAGTPCPD